MYSSKWRTHHVASSSTQAAEASSLDPVYIGNVHSVSHNTSNPHIRVDLEINDIPISMELDTGAFVSIIPEAVWNKSGSNVQ